MLHINSVYCVPNIIEIGQHLYKLQSYEKGGYFSEHSVVCVILTHITKITSISGEKQWKPAMETHATTVNTVQCKT